MFKTLKLKTTALLTTVSALATFAIVPISQTVVHADSIQTEKLTNVAEPEFRTSTQRINYRFADTGKIAVKPVIRSVTFKRYKMTNSQTGKVTYTPWSIYSTTTN